MMRGDREKLDYRIEGDAKVSRLAAQFSLLGGGIAWTIHFLAIWAISEFGCIAGLGRRVIGGWSVVAWLILLATVIAALIAAAAIYTSVRDKKILHDANGDAAVIAAENKSFMSRASVLTNGMFLFIILVQAIPVFFYLRSC